MHHPAVRFAKPIGQPISSIGRVGVDASDARSDFFQIRQQVARSLVIFPVCTMQQHGNYQPQRVHHDVPLAARDFVGSFVITFVDPFGGVCRLAVHDARRGLQLAAYCCARSKATVHMIAMACRIVLHDRLVGNLGLALQPRAASVLLVRLVRGRYGATIRARSVDVALKVV